MTDTRHLILTGDQLDRALDLLQQLVTLRNTTRALPVGSIERWHASLRFTELYQEFEGIVCPGDRG